MSEPRPLVIAHRGACGYLPEHTLEAKALAHGMGADILEQDVVVSRDDELIVLHDIHLEHVTDVASRFPGRARDDGRYYVRDFDLDELRTLAVHERSRDTAGREPVFPGRFPPGQGRFRIATLADELAMIDGLNRSTERQVGIYPEIKRPAWHRAEGVDSAALLLDALARHGYDDADAPAWVQCFDPDELLRVRRELGCRLRLVQLIGQNDWGESAADYEAMQTAEGLAVVAGYADAVGPWLRQLYRLDPVDGSALSSGFVDRAHAAGLAVHPFTFRVDSLEPGFDDFDAMVRWFSESLGIDGLFTDFPDRALAALGR